MNLKSHFRIVLWFSLLIAAFSVPARAENTQAYRILGEIPVQHSGRVKPFQSFAQEAVLFITGKNSFQHTPADQMVWQWMTEPEKWSRQPLIPVSYRALQDEFPLMLIRGRISPELALGHDPFLKHVEAAMAKREKKEKLSTLEQKRLEVYERAYLFRLIGEGQVPGWIAHPENLKNSWLPLQAFATNEGQAALAQFFPAGKVEKVKSSLDQLFQLLRADSLEPAQEAAAKFSRSLNELFESRGIFLDREILQMEVTYNHLQPFRWAWKFYLLSVALFTGLILIAKRGINRIIFPAALLFFLAGFALHSYGFYLRCMIAGRPPVTNMYESIIWVSWAVVLFSTLLFAGYRSAMIPMTAGLVASLALIVAQGFPTVLDPAVSPLVPVLRSNLWLSIHVLTITLSYGAFALAWGIGHAAVFTSAFAPEKWETHQKLSQYLYRTLQIGVVLLASGTVLGGVWANYSWGRFWGWDPKETWALIALLGYLAVLHGRFAGWLSAFGFALSSTFAFLGVLMAWYGVNFVLAAGLHSYGFGGGGLPYVSAVVVFDFALLGWAAMVYKKSGNKRQAEAAVKQY